MKNKKLYFLFALFIFPVVAGTLLYEFRGFFHFSTTNHGVLVNPPIAVSQFQNNIQNNIQNNRQKKWQIVYVTDGVCDDACKKIDFQLHQVQTLLGKDQSRVSVTQSSDLNDESILMKKAFQARDSRFVVSQKIYLIDPAGNIFMYYPATSNPLDIYHDLKHVLEVSQIG